MTSRGLILAGLLLGLVCLPLAAQDSPIPPSQPVFGVVEGFWFPERVCELGVTWERIIFDWAQHQPDGPDDWHTLNVDDRWLKAASACGREVVAVIKHTPAWATGGPPGPGVPRGLDLPIDDPGNVWARFVRRAAAYYASRGVRHFILMNEPDITPDTYGFEFEGTVDDYYRVLRAGYLAAREGNPDAVIHVAGMTYWHDVNAGRRLNLDRLLERIAADPEAAANRYYFDAISLHIYFRTDSVYDIVREMRGILDTYGLQDKTIWITETDAAPTEDPAWPVERPQFHAINLAQQAAYLTQAAALGLAAGAERIAAYKFYDQQLSPGGETFGLLSPVDGSPRPAFYAWQAVNRTFTGVESAHLARSDTVDVVRLRHYNGRQTLVLWARTADPVSVQIAATSSKADLLDLYGGVTIMRPADGRYMLTLPGARCDPVDGCPVGGTVSILIQPDGEAAVDEVTPSGPVTLMFE